jgi:nitrate reductase gamma subunit
MEWYQYVALASLVICIVACTWHFIRLVRLGKPKDLSKKSGNVLQAEAYSYTIAMLPNQKESVYLHVPSFIAGVLFHVGTFISLFLFFVFFFVDPLLLREWLILALAVFFASLFLVVSVISGLALLFKRILLKKIRTLSTWDDYLSNFLTTSFQFFTAFYLIFPDAVATYYYLFASILLLYLPVGKLRHAVYFFAARYQLGFFYGWRNSWPPKKQK